MPTPGVPYFFGGGGTAVGTWKPTGGTAAGRAAQLAINPNLGNITTVGSQYLYLNGFSGLFTISGTSGNIYLTDTALAPKMALAFGTTVVHPNDAGYPSTNFANGPGYWGIIIYWASAGYGGFGDLADAGDFRTAGYLYLAPPPTPPGYWTDPMGNPFPLPIAGYPPGTYPDPVTGQPVVPPILNVPGAPPPPPPSNPPVFGAPPPPPGTIPPPGTDGLFTSNPPGTINWRLHRCDLKPREEEKG